MTGKLYVNLENWFIALTKKSLNFTSMHISGEVNLILDHFCFFLFRVKFFSKNGQKIWKNVSNMLTSFFKKNGFLKLKFDSDFQIKKCINLIANFSRFALKRSPKFKSSLNVQSLFNVWSAIRLLFHYLWLSNKKLDCWWCIHNKSFSFRFPILLLPLRIINVTNRRRDCLWMFPRSFFASFFPFLHHSPI